MRVVFVGPPGSGKGTQAQLLTERLGLTYIGTGDIFREAMRQDSLLGQTVREYISAGQLVPDEVVNAVVAERLRQANPRPRCFIMDGYPRTLFQARSLDAVLTELKMPLHKVIGFQIEDAEAMRRLSGRGRADDDETTARTRQRIDRENASQLMDYYRSRGLLHEVPAVGTMETIYARIVSILQPWAG